MNLDAVGPEVFQAEKRRQERAKQVHPMGRDTAVKAEFDLSHLKPNPEAATALRMAQERAFSERTARMWAEAGAPARQAQTTALDREGEWGARERLILEKVGKGSLLALVGIRGCGKTQLAVEVVRHATAHGRAAWFRLAEDFFLDIKAAWKNKTEDERDVIKRYCAPSLLVLDEAGQRSESEWENRLLFSVINRRYQDAKDTLLISNQDRAQLESALGASIISRLNECGGFIECAWPSYREIQ